MTLKGTQSLSFFICVLVISIRTFKVSSLKLQYYGDKKPAAKRRQLQNYLQVSTILIICFASYCHVYWLHLSQLDLSEYETQSNLQSPITWTSPFQRMKQSEHPQDNAQHHLVVAEN